MEGLWKEKDDSVFDIFRYFQKDGHVVMAGHSDPGLLTAKFKSSCAGLEARAKAETCFVWAY